MKAQAGRIQVLSQSELLASCRDVLLVAELPPGLIERTRVSRRAAKDVVARARALAKLVELVLSRDWDRTFYLVDNRVFIRFSADGLFSGQREDVRKILAVLREFGLWRDAMLLVADAVSDTQSISGQDQDDRLRSATEVIDAARASRVGKRGSLHDVFVSWCQSAARRSEYDVVAGTVGGDEFVSNMPPYVKILKTERVAAGTMPKISGLEDALGRATPAQLVTTSDGGRYLFPLNDGERPILPGDLICFSMDQVKDAPGLVLATRGSAK